MCKAEKNSRNMFNNSFYITLPSNASMQLYPENTLASYTNKLAHRVSLKEDDWEVGLVEIQYPAVFANIKTKDVWMTVNYTYNKAQNKKIISMPDGIYDTIDNLLSLLNEKFKSTPAIDLEFEYLSKINRIKTTFAVNAAEKISTIALSPILATVLGFILPVDAENIVSFILYTDYEGFDKSSSSNIHNQILVSLKETSNTTVILKAPYPPSLEFGIPPHMYIYSDIVAPNLIGDVMAPLLRIVKIGEIGKDICQTFTEPYYIPVLKRDFETVEINIRKDNGNLVPFLSGKLNVRLHFRRYGALSKKSD